MVNEQYRKNPEAADLHIVSAYLGGFRHHPGQLTENPAAYRREMDGMAAAPGRDERIIGERPEVVVADEDAVAVVLGAVERDGLEVADDDAYAIIQALLSHLQRIGALGPLA